MHRWQIIFSNCFSSIQNFEQKLAKKAFHLLPILLVLHLPIAQSQTQLATQSQSQTQSSETRYHKTAKFGNMIVQSNNLLTLDEKTYSFAPAVKIFSDRQRLIRPSSLLNEKVAVAYLIDRHNDVSQVWVLTLDEVKQITSKKN